MALDPTSTFIVRGTVTSPTNAPLPNLIVRAFDRELRIVKQIGEAKTAANGAYAINYTVDQLARPGKTAANLIVRVFDASGSEASASQLLMNAPKIAQINLKVNLGPQATPTELDQLASKLTPLLGDELLEQLTAEDIDVLAKDSGVERAQIEALVRAAQVFQETGIPPDALYALARQNIALDPSKLAAGKPGDLRAAIERAVQAGKVSTKTRDSLDVTLDRFVRWRGRVGLRQTRELLGRVVNSRTAAPLSGLTVVALDAVEDAKPRELDRTISDLRGLFSIRYDAAAAATDRPLRLQILNDKSVQLLVTDVVAKQTQQTLVDIKVPVPDAAPAPSPTIAALASATNLTVPPQLTQFLTQRRLATLADVRRAGGLRKLAGLPVPPDHPAVGAIDAHASLNAVSADIAANASLIAGGSRNVVDIANAGRVKVVGGVRNKLGDARAAQIHVQAIAQNALLKNAIAHLRAEQANGFETPLPGIVLSDIAADAVAACECKNCEAAISPLAYLADLLDYAATHLRNNDNVVTLNGLADLVRQPLQNLPASCEAADAQLPQVRLCIEVLRGHLVAASLPASGSPQASALARAERAYRVSAYTGLLAVLGASYEALRLSRIADTEEQRTLAERLGIAADQLPTLLLEPNQITEFKLEELFGLVDTTRDPLAAGPDEARQLTLRKQRLRAVWLAQDWPNPDPPPGDAYPLIDPDLIGPGDFVNPVPADPAFKLWDARRKELAQRLQAVRTQREGQANQLAGWDAIVGTALGIPAAQVVALDEQRRGGKDVAPRLRELHLAMDAFDYLIRIRRLLQASAGASALPSEWDQVHSILVQVHKDKQIPTWRGQEKTAGLTLGPDRFRIPAPSMQFPPPQPQVLPAWRASEAARRAWQEKLQARIDQEQTAGDTLRAAVAGIESETLPALRDALVVAAGEDARTLARRLLIDCEANGGLQTSRAQQAIDTMQTLILSVRTGQIGDTHPQLTLDADDFDEEWQWLSSYPAWRAALLVFLYPENVLLPSLRRWQTPVFVQLVDETRNDARLTPEKACGLANRYSEYLREVCALDRPHAAVIARVEAHAAKCRANGFEGDRYRVYMFALHGTSGRVYASSFDPEDETGYAQSFWENGPKFKRAIEVVGAAAYRYEDARYIYVFGRTVSGGGQKLMYARYDLTLDRWSGEPEELELPDGADNFQAVVKQRHHEDEPPQLAIRAPNGAIHVRMLNKEGRTWEDGDWDTPRVPRIQGRRYSKLRGMVEPAPGEFFIFAETEERSIEYRLFGNRGDGRWIPLIQDISATYLGSFPWPGTEQVYVYWQEAEGPQSYYQILARSADPLGRRKITSIAQFDASWLKPIAGLSLAGLAIEVDGMSVLDFLTEQSDETRGRRLIKRLAEKADTNDEPGWRDWNEAARLVQTFAGASLQYVLTTLFVARVRGSAAEVLFKHRDISQELLGLFEGPRALERIVMGCGQAPAALARRVVYRRRASSGGGQQVAAMAISLPHGGEASHDWMGTSIPEAFVRATAERQANGSLVLSSPVSAAPLISVPFEITERLSSDELQVRRTKIREAFATLEDAPASIRAYLEEAYYFVPVQLALQLQQRGQYQAALDWFRSVYDYNQPELMRKIYHGLVREESLDSLYERAEEWLLDPLNPHAVASTRRNTYTRFTVLSLARCFLAFANAEFARDTAASVARARTLYSSAVHLLQLNVLRQRLGECEAVIGELDIQIGQDLAAEPSWGQVWDELKLTLRRIGDPRRLKPLLSQIKTTWASTAAVDARLAKARQIIQSAPAAPAPRLGAIVASRPQVSAAIHTALFTQPTVARALPRFGEKLGNDFRRTVSLVSEVAESRLASESVMLPWLTQKAAAAGGITGAGSAIKAGNVVAKPVNRSTSIGLAQPLRSLQQSRRFRPGYIPAPSLSFCVPSNPMITALAMSGEVNLYKLRTGRNIAGDERQLELYSADDLDSALPSIGTSGTILVPGTAHLTPTPYRYAVLIERAKQLASFAQQIENAFLSTLEKRDAEYYSLLKARQEVSLARAGVQLQELRVKEAEGGVQLAEFQRGRAATQREHYQDLLDRGPNSYEISSLAMMVLSLYVPDSVSVSFGFPGGLDFSASYSPSGKLQTLASILSTKASFERREEEWGLQRDLARHDMQIATQQIRLAQDHVRITGQERTIAQLQADHAAATAEFLATKFTNVELYEWMSVILEGVYSFFLQHATTTAQLAASQLAFERQQIVPPFVQADYWDAPLGIIAGGGGDTPDRRGLTGSARLLQDVFRLDQHAFSTDQRKLQLTKVISLAQFAPSEFQRFREAGVLRFNTALELFDRDFPGHYLRLIKRVRTSVIALIPPTEGIKAVLSCSGISRVAVPRDGSFQIMEMTRPPETVALCSPRESSGVFELLPQQQEFLLPFEGWGVDTAWQLQLPKAANLFDFNTIADVLLTFEYTALGSFEYRQQVIQQMNRTVSADRPFSLRQQFADQWYDLNNAEQTPTPMVVVLRTARQDFPPNLDELRIQQVVLFFSRRDPPAGQPNFEIGATLTLTPDGQPAVGGAATSIDGVISTRRGNAAAWVPIMGKSPIGEWKLTLPNTDEVKARFKNEQIQDILLNITYAGRTPEWPA